MRAQVRSYIHLLKPGITVSNTVSAVAGYFLAVATTGIFDGLKLVGLIFGIAGVIGSACVANNILDWKIDAQMKRTKRRAVATGEISRKIAAAYAILLGVIGFVLIFSLANTLTGMLGVIAYVSYVVFYGAAKRTTKWSTVIGTLPGALPLVAGYTTLTGQLELVAGILFLMMTFWQLGHFYAIAMFRQSDYAAADLPVWSVAKGMASTKRQLFLFVWLFFLTTPLLTIIGVTGAVYAVVMSGLALFWVGQGVRYYRGDDVVWARKMFFVSLSVLLVMCVLIAIGGFLP
jgi:protoheme IX farnesyltransferase